MSEQTVPASIEEYFKSIAEPRDPALAAIRRLAMRVWDERDALVRWPRRSEWTQGPFLRVAKAGKVRYPAEIVALCRGRGVEPDTLENGPATTAFRLAGGEVPYTGRTWHVHHIYDGGHPIPGWGVTTHAKKHKEYFTHPAGLVAIPPAIHKLASADEWLAWKFRLEAWERFEFDPDGVFKHWQTASGT